MSKKLRLLAFLAAVWFAFSAAGQTAAWVFEQKNGLRKDTLEANEIIQTYWKTKPREAVEARLAGIRNDSIFLKIGSEGTFGSPIKGLKKLTFESKMPEVLAFQKTRIRLIFTLIGAFLMLFGAIRFLGNGDNSNDPSGTFGCCGGLLIFLVAGFALMMVRTKSQTQVIEWPAREWQIKQIEVP